METPDLDTYTLDELRASIRAFMLVIATIHEHLELYREIVNDMRAELSRRGES